MSRTIFFFSAILILFSSNNIYSQDPPIEWEEIPLSDLQMKSFPADTNASAVILCDYGETFINDDLNLEFKRHLRIKILNEKGYEWGTHSIYLYTGDDGDRLDELEGITYSLDDNGEIVETELDDDEIFEEEVTDTRTKYNFTMPALKPGCVLDITYTIIADNIWSVRGWTFQREEPVLWSEYRITCPKNISYAAVSLGYEIWTIKESKEVSKIFRGLASTYLGNIVECNQYRWVLKDAPALRDEPYITTIADYQNRVDIQLAAYSFIQIGLKKVLNDWKTLSNELLDLRSFGDMIDVTGDVEDLTKEITSGMTSNLEKMKAIYNWIINSVVWTGEETLYADYDPDEVIEYKKGNSADITFLLISMLKSISIEADPVILSTRPNGKIQEIYPIASQFDYVIARVILGTTTFYLDATDPYRNYDLLPEKVLNVKGLVVKENMPQWVIVPSLNNNINKTIINVVLNEDGSLSADFEEQYGEYKSCSIRKDLSSKSEIEIAKELFNAEANSFTIDSVTITDKDSIGNPFRIHTWISSSSYSQQGGDFIYFNPTMIHRLTDNPFKAQSRKFPVDYGYKHGQLIITNITLPPGYEVKEKYNNKNINVSNSASYKRIVDISDNHVQIMNKMDIKEVEVMPKYYKTLKDFYSEVVQAQSEMMVFGKAEIPAGIKDHGELKSEGTK